MDANQRKAVLWAVLAAGLYALNAPLSKLLLGEVAPTMMAALLYLGAGFGMLVLGMVQKGMGLPQNEKPLMRAELPYIIAMVLLDIAAPILLMVGLAQTTAANASLLNNFEIVATSLLALFVFNETISLRLWLGIALVTLASMLLSFGDSGSLHFSIGSVFVLLACVCWGFENNCTRRISTKNPAQIVVIKGLGSGFGALAIALASGEVSAGAGYIAGALLLGFVSYGLSIFFYIHAQRHLGAAKTSAYYALAPFIGVALSLLIFRETPNIAFVAALCIMFIGTYFASTDTQQRTRR